MRGSMGRAMTWAWAHWTVLCCALAAALGMPALALIGPDLIYDDARFLASFQGGGPWSCFAPFRFEALYWRPLGTLSMCAPLWASGWTGAAAAFAASKAVSVALAVVAACVGVAASARMARGLGEQGGARSAAALACSAVLLAFSPILAEPTMWWSGRFDALLMALLMGMMMRMGATQKDGARVGEAFAWGLALCASKETGAAWAGLLAVLLWSRPDSRSWSAGLGASLSIYLPARAAVAKWWTAPGLMLPGTMGVEWKGKGPGEMAWSALESLGRQATMLVAPVFDMDPAHGERLGPVWTYAVGAAAAGLIVWTWGRHARRARRGEAHWGEAWACAALAMMVVGAAKAATVWYPGELLSPQLAPGRFLAPSAMVLWVIAGAWIASAKPGSRAQAALWVLGASAALCLPLGWQARAEWASELRLKEAVVRYGHPNSWSVGSLALALSERGEVERAQAIAIDWIGRSPNGIPMCELWTIAEGGPRPLSLSIQASIARRRSEAAPCPRPRALGPIVDKASAGG